MTLPESENEALLARAQAGDHAASEELLAKHRGRLRQMVSARIDTRLAGRLDPSDVVQEALADAARKLPAYLQDRPLPLYPWLRRLTCERLAKLHRHHRGGKRAIDRERDLADASADLLAKFFATSATSPSGRAGRREQHERVRAALDQLSERDREVLVLRYLEQLSTRETAEALGIREGAVKVRHLRALQRLRLLLGEDFLESPT